ncbi:MAG: type 1 glutamine amidotransferase domain-containing protein [Janthinobacterium lividum]
MKILMVLTSHDRLGDTGRETGVWLEDFAASYFAFRDAGVEIVLTSPKGGRAPIDPRSDDQSNRTAATRRLRGDVNAEVALSGTRPLAEVSPEGFAAVFYPGGHGSLWDLAYDPRSTARVEAFHRSGRPVATVSQASAVLRGARALGRPLVAGRVVTGSSNAEEEDVGLSDVLPFRVEDELRMLGGLFESIGSRRSCVVRDGCLITGQNPASSLSVAVELIRVIGTTGSRQDRVLTAA